MIRSKCALAALVIAVATTGTWAATPQSTGWTGKFDQYWADQGGGINNWSNGIPGDYNNGTTFIRDIYYGQAWADNGRSGSTISENNYAFKNYNGGYYSGHLIYFQHISGSADQSFVVQGDAFTLYSFDVVNPKIENQSSVVQTVKNNLTFSPAGNTSELNPVNGDLVLSGTINSDAGDVIVYGANNATTSHTLNLNGSLSLANVKYLKIQQNATVRVGGVSAAGVASSGAAITNLGGLQINYGKLGGNGSISGAGTVYVTSGGTITAGTSDLASGTGTLHTGTEEWDSGGTYQWKLASPTGTEGGTGWDKLVMGTLKVVTTSTKFNIHISDPVGSGSLSFASRHSFPIASFSSSNGLNTSNLSSQFALAIDQSILDRSSLSANAFSLKYNPSSDGNDAYISVEVDTSPEPTTALLFGAGGVGLFSSRRRRQAIA